MDRYVTHIGFNPFQIDYSYRKLADTGETYIIYNYIFRKKVVASEPVFVKVSVRYPSADDIVTQSTYLQNPINKIKDDWPGIKSSVVIEWSDETRDVHLFDDERNALQFCYEMEDKWLKYNPKMHNIKKM